MLVEVLWQSAANHLDRILPATLFLDPVLDEAKLNVLLLSGIVGFKKLKPAY